MSPGLSTLPALDCIFSAALQQLDGCCLQNRQELRFPVDRQTAGGKPEADPRTLWCQNLRCVPCSCCIQRPGDQDTAPALQQCGVEARGLDLQRQLLQHSRGLGPHPPAVAVLFEGWFWVGRGCLLLVYVCLHV